MIHVLGWYDSKNIGDESYKITFPKLFPNNEFSFGEEVKGSPDTIILGGGDVLNPYFVDKLKYFPKAKKYAFSVNVREGDDLSMFDKVLARNITTKAPQCPDFAFILEPNKTNGRNIVKEIFEKYDADLYENLVILSLNSFLCVGDNLLARDYVTFEKLAFDLSVLMDTTNASFLLLPFGNGFPHNDRIANSFAYANTKFWKKNVLLFDKLTVQETLDVFSAANAAITTRLHAAIFSCVANVPFIDITHHSKNAMFMEFIGKSNWSIDFWHFDWFKTQMLINEFLEKPQLKLEVSEIDLRLKRWLLGMTAFQL